MLQHQIFRTPSPGEPLILAAFSFRYDAHLVPDLLENLRPAVHGYVAWDDRASVGVLSDEPARRARLVAAAQGLGAGWLLTPDPDERFEQGFPDAMPGLLEQGEGNLWFFSLYEMFSPTEYRSDGLWGGKSVLRLFPLAAAGCDPKEALHGRWVADETGFQRRIARINLYHLRMAHRLRRQLRRDLYAASDPDRRFQALGYDYLADDRGMVLEPLPPGRAFAPAFVEDNGIWAPDPGRLGPVRPDPYPACLARAAASANRRGKLAAHHVLMDLSRHWPQDRDLRQVAARFALESGAPDLALATVPPSRTDRPGDRWVRALAHLALGARKPAGEELARLRALAPRSPILAALAEEVARPDADLGAATAGWRGIAPDATWHEGPDIARSDLAVTVISYANQPGLLQAVQSLLMQDEVPEIVVVNSGGGDPVSSLAPVLCRIRLISTEKPLFVGAARNIGVAASRAPYLAFLAGDCLARPGWVSGRLRRHRAGAAAVATAVVAEAETTLVARAINQLRYASRQPDADPRLVLFYGQSYARTLLRLVGQFPPGLRVGEDSALNRTVAMLTTPVWEPAVQTVHRDIRTLLPLIRDERLRGQRRAAHAPFRSFAARHDPTPPAAQELSRRLASAQAYLAKQLGVGSAERRAVAAMQWLATSADLSGTLEGMAQIAKANVLMAQAKAAGDATIAREACRLDTQDPAKACSLGHLLRRAGDLSGAEAAYRAALALDPAHVASADALVALVRRLRGATAGWREAEALVLAHPMTRQHWQRAAEAARAAGLSDWALALGQAMLAQAVDHAGSHALLARLHADTGHPVAMLRRFLSARQLRQARPVQGSGKPTQSSGV